MRDINANGEDNGNSVPPQCGGLQRPQQRQRQQRQQPRGSAKAFSLVEIMIVIVIMGLLAGVVSVNVRSYINKAKQNTARQEIATIIHALETFYAANGHYPTNDEGIAILTQPSAKWPEPPLKAVPLDPWGRPYQYNSPGSAGPYEVICYGADGREGGAGIDADISSDKLKE